MPLIAARLCWLTAVAFAVAGGAKLVDLGEFEGQLAGWSLLPHGLVRFGVVIGVPVVEIGLCAMYACFPARRRVVAAWMLVLLGVFSMAYAFEAFTGIPPDCACFGLFSRQLEFQNDAAWVLGRNAALGVPPMLVLWTGRRRASDAAAPTQDTRGVRGFTLLEMLVVITVIATIVAILLPALRYARRSGRESATLNNLRQHAGIFLLYGHDYREQFPYFTRPEPGASTPLVDPSGRVWKTNYFGAYRNWPIALSHGYYNGTGTRAGFASPFRAESPDSSWDYLYPCVFLADPTYWRYETRMVPPAQFRSTRHGDVAYPSAKVLLSDERYWEATKYSPSPRAAGGCVDGHAELVAASRLAPQYVLGEGTGSPLSSQYGFHAGRYDAFMHTIGGCAERDFYPK